MAKKYRTLIKGKRKEQRAARLGKTTTQTARKSSGGSSKTREQMEAETKARLLGGVAQQDTKSGAYLRGETVTTSTGGRINVSGDPGLTGQPGAQPTAFGQAPPGTLGGDFPMRDSGQGVSISAPKKSAWQSVKDIYNWANPVPGQLGGIVELPDGTVMGTPPIMGWTLGGTTQLAKIPGTVQTIATNTKTISTTAKWIKAIAGGTVAAAIMGAIGSYPFAGFIKEESLQTLGFGVNTAVNNDDLEGAEDALAFQREILDPDVWDKIKSGVPYVNVLNNLNDFYDAAKIKLTIDAQKVKDMRIQIETGESENDKWARVRQEEADQDKAAVDYYNEERKKLLNWEGEEKRKEKDWMQEKDRRAARDTAKLWADHAAKQRELEAADRAAIAAFWLEYRKEIMRMQDENRPSKLNFGIV